MNFFKKLFATLPGKQAENPSASTSKPDSALQNSLPTSPQTPIGSVKILKKSEEGTFLESKGDVSDVAPLFSMAYPIYQRVMAAARSNSLTASHERELLEAVDLFTKIIELHGTRGEPYS